MVFSSLAQPIKSLFLQRTEQKGRSGKSLVQLMPILQFGQLDSNIFFFIVMALLLRIGNVGAWFQFAGIGGLNYDYYR